MKYLFPLTLISTKNHKIRNDPKFIIQNEDQINVKIDNKQMFEHLEEGKKISDSFINTRSSFIFQFIKQRKLKINYELITPEENYVSKLI